MRVDAHHQSLNFVQAGSSNQQVIYVGHPMTMAFLVDIDSYSNMYVNPGPGRYLLQGAAFHRQHLLKISISKEGQGGQQWTDVCLAWSFKG